MCQYASIAKLTIGADANAQHVISHFEGAGVLNGQLPSTRLLIHSYGPLPELDLMVCAAAHKATVHTQHLVLTQLTALEEHRAFFEVYWQLRRDGRVICTLKS